MKIQFCSDLHLEFKDNKNFLRENPIVPVGDILLLAGDIVPFTVMDDHDDFFDFVSDNFKQAYWIPGNHEYYYSDIAVKPFSFQEKIRSNVSLVNNVAISESNVKFIFSTMWSKIRPADMRTIQQSMSDFKVIKKNEGIFNPQDFNELHNLCLAFISDQLKINNIDKTIVVTHHIPTFLNYPEKYKGDILNDAFAVELFDLIEGSKADAWIYGHNHFNQPNFRIGSTNLLTNQLGYVKFGENTGFSHNNLIFI